MLNYELFLKLIFLKLIIHPSVFWAFLIIFYFIYHSKSTTTIPCEQGWFLFADLWGCDVMMSMAEILKIKDNMQDIMTNHQKD